MRALTWGMNRQLIRPLYLPCRKMSTGTGDPAPQALCSNDTDTAAELVVTNTFRLRQAPSNASPFCLEMLLTRIKFLLHFLIILFFRVAELPQPGPICPSLDFPGVKVSQCHQLRAPWVPMISPVWRSGGLSQVLVFILTCAYMYLLFACLLLFFFGTMFCFHTQKPNYLLSPFWRRPFSVAPIALLATLVTCCSSQFRENIGAEVIGCQAPPPKRCTGVLLQTCCGDCTRLWGVAQGTALTWHAQLMHSSVTTKENEWLVAWKPHGIHSVSWQLCR